MTTQQTDALQCAADLEYSIARHGMQDAFTLNAYRAMKMVRTQHARITELESQLAQRFDAADMATASAQGFRDGVASVSAGWQSIETAPKDGQAILVTDGWGCYCVEWNEEFDWWTVDDNKLGPFRLRCSSPTHWMPLPAAPGPADGESNE